MNGVARNWPKTCELCKKYQAIVGERFCRECRKIKIKEMKDAGYLGPKPIGHTGQMRPREARENEYETQYGTD